jgi:hypothetical protein
MMEQWTEKFWGENNILNVTEQLDSDYCFRIEIALSSRTKKLSFVVTSSRQAAENFAVYIPNK